MEKTQTKRNYSFRPLSDLNLIDNFLFQTISSMEGISEEFYGILLPVLLGKKVQILDIIPQRDIPGLDTNRHGIRIDAYVRALDDDAASRGKESTDSNNEAGKEQQFVSDAHKARHGDAASTAGTAKPAIYDVEPNNRVDDRPSLPRRNRFYTGIIDVQTLRSGAAYADVADLVIINILSYDPFGAGELWYEARNNLITHPDIPYEDGVRHIYLYCNGRLNPAVLEQVGIEDGETLRDMLHYFCNSKTTQAVSTPLKQMDALVNRVKDRKEVSINYMITFNHDEDMRAEGRKEGRAEGRAENRADMAGLFKMLKTQGRSDEFEQAMEDASVLDHLLEEYHSSVHSAV